MQKILIGLLCIQSIAIFFFGFRVMEIDARTLELSQSQQAIRNQFETATKAQPSYAAASTTPTIDGERIRQILKEELADLSKDNAGPAPQARAAAVAADRNTGGEQPRSSALARMNYELDAFVQKGRMDESEMAQFQLRLGELPPAQQNEMLSKLTKAINSGQLDAQF